MQYLYTQEEHDAIEKRIAEGIKKKEQNIEKFLVRFVKEYPQNSMGFGLDYASFGEFVARIAKESGL